MKYQKLGTLLIALLLVQTSSLLAQEDIEELIPQHPYTVCDWGLIVIEEGASSLHITGIENSAGGITISGTGQGLFENNVVIQALDNDGEVVAEMSTTMTSEEVGGAGEWSAELSVPVEVDTFGALVALSLSPVDGDPMAQDEAFVTFRVDDSLIFMLTNDPVKGAFIVDDSFIRTSGTGQAGEDNRVLILVETLTGRDMLNETTSLDNGTWAIDQPILFDLVDTPTAVWYAASLLDEAQENPLAYDYVPVLIGGSLSDFATVLRITEDDMILTADEPCEAAQNQMSGAGVQIALTVDSVLVQSALSEPPQASLFISGSQPASCDFPLRTVLTRDETRINAEIYHYVPADAGCGGDRVPYSASIHLGELTDGDITFSANGISAE